MSSTHSADELNDLLRTKQLVNKKPENLGLNIISVKLQEFHRPLAAFHKKNIGRLQIIALQCSYFRGSSGKITSKPHV